MEHVSLKSILGTGRLTCHLLQPFSSRDSSYQQTIINDHV